MIDKAQSMHLNENSLDLSNAINIKILDMLSEFRLK